jgi:diacylglycerol kinase family enzyme
VFSVINPISARMSLPFKRLPPLGLSRVFARLHQRDNEADVISRTPIPEANQFARGITAILNVGSGSQRQHELAEIVTRVFAENGIDIDVQLAHRPADIPRFTRAAIESRKSMVMAGGGDGTISTVASVLSGTGTLLGVLPCGTFNYFARLLGIPLDPEAATRACIDGEIKSVPLGEVNGRVFLNNASMGLYPALLRQREESYKRWGRSQFIAYISAAWGLVRPRSHLEIDMIVDGKEKRFFTPLIFSASNRNQIEEFGMPGAPCIDQHKLAFYVLPPVGRLGLLRLGWRMIRRKLTPAKDFQLLCSDEAHVHTRRRTITVAYDGEFERMESPLTFRLKPDAVRVLVPRQTSRQENAA